MPNLRVIEGAPDAEITRKRAEDDLRWPVKELASNIMRIVRGAGRPDDLIDQMHRVLVLCDAYRKSVGTPPAGDVFSRLLYLDDPYLDSDAVLERATHPVCRAALQICASRLVGQDMQLRTAEGEFVMRMLGSVRAHDERTGARRRKVNKGSRKDSGSNDKGR